MNDLRNCVNSKKSPENVTPNKIINTVENFHDFNKQQKGKGLGIPISQPMFQGLPVALAQSKIR